MTESKKQPGNISQADSKKKHYFPREVDFQEGNKTGN